MKFDDETMPLYIETDVSGVRLGAALLLKGVLQATLEMKHQTTVFSDPLHS